jgi:hypothetical protein
LRHFELARATGLEEFFKAKGEAPPSPGYGAASECRITKPENMRDIRCRNLSAFDSEDVRELIFVIHTSFVIRISSFF